MSNDWNYICYFDIQDFSTLKLKKLFEYISIFDLDMKNSSIYTEVNGEDDSYRFNNKNEALEFYYKYLGCITFSDDSLDISFDLRTIIDRKFNYIEICFPASLFVKDLEFREKAFMIGEEIFKKIIEIFNCYHGYLCDDYSYEDLMEKMGDSMYMNNNYLYYKNYYSFKYIEMIDFFRSLNIDISIEDNGFFAILFNKYPWDLSFDNLYKYNIKFREAKLNNKIE